MAYEVDLTKKLSEDDLRFLVDRNRWDDIRKNAENLGLDVPNLPSARGIRAQTPRVELRRAQAPFDKSAKMLGVKTDGDPDETEEQRSVAPNTVSTEQSDEPKTVDYNKLTVPQLQEELDKRRQDYEAAGDNDAVADVSYTSDDRKSDLVRKLQDDDAAQADDGE